MANEDIHHVCDGARRAVIYDAALLRLAQPATLRTLPRLDESARARLLSSCTWLLCNEVKLAAEDNTDERSDAGASGGASPAVVTGVPVIVALLQILRHANVVYVRTIHPCC